MSCCCPHSRSGGRFFSRFAQRSRRRFDKKGFERSQRQLLDGVRAVGVDNATILEIGSGIGALHQELLKLGAATAVGIDLSEKMIEEAEALARKHHLADRTRYRVGDFAEDADSFDAADIVLLDKVICCYPDAERLVKTSVAKARHIYAYTIPRDRWFSRLGAVVVALALRIAGFDFRSYVHDPTQIEAWVSAAGFTKRYENRTPIWLTAVYVHTQGSTHRDS
jgi:2-polyprenyl-3-methyl-5-hydroxy-6-metoxy-1,4-benzoquinol methylase